MRNQHTPIAAEGYPFIAGAGIITLVLVLLSWKVASVLALALTFFVVYFFRNPQRNPPEGENNVLAPADGVITYLGSARESHLDVEMTKISIFMSVFDVHVNRIPCSGKVMDTFYLKGKFHDARDDKATFENEQGGMIIETGHGVRIVVVQVAGLIARRIVSYVKKGDMLERGRRFGMIRFGSRLDIYLPPETDILVKPGQRTVAGETVLGRLP